MLVSDYLLNPIIDLQTGVNAGQGGMTDAMPFLLPLIAALVISMAIIPFMIRLAPVLGMIDKPDPRKVHAVPIPRVGGVGIVIGALLPLVLLLPLDNSLASFLLGACVLLIFGAWDDSHELGHYVKFLGQFIAVLAVVYYGDVFVTRLPFMGGELVPEYIGRPFTVFAMIGMINAINHSDGLDGLAGGESLMSLACIAWLAYSAGGMTATIIALATIGGLFGFLRFNTHPARIFMGDGGSQFLGFTLGYLAVVLTQEVNTAMSPALPVLILGLPIADIIAVLIQRIYHRMNWFRATRNHIHHRLLDLGFQHYESVLVVYTLQALLVMSALAMPYESDFLIIGIYVAVVLSIFLFLYISERRGWQLHSQDETAALNGAIDLAKKGILLRALPYAVVMYGTSLFLLAGSLISVEIPRDYTVIAIIISVLMTLRLILGFRVWFISLRLMVYVTIAFMVYLLNSYQPVYLSGVDPVTYVYFGVLVAAIALTLRFTNGGNFDVTPMDYLVMLAILALVLSSSVGAIDTRITAMALKGVILFYAGEMILKNMKRRWNVFTVSVLVSLVIVGVRGVMGNYL